MTARGRILPAMRVLMILGVLAGCGGSTARIDAGTTDSGGGRPDGEPGTGIDGTPLTGPQLGGCPLLPADHVFNTAIDDLPVHANSAQFIATIGGGTTIHLDLGTETDQQGAEFYGIPWNLVRGDALTWKTVAFATTDGDLDWDPRPESDCAVGSGHAFTQPCTAANAPAPLLPIPDDVIVEGGVDTSADHQPYGDHHILVIDQDTCMLWETYHSYFNGGTWNIYGAAGFDLTANALRPDGWTSADAAGFPILPLLMRADEAAAGEIRHALRFTINSDKIRTSYTWPARHLTGNGTASTSLPQMGQLFRLKASYVIPAGASAQTRAILTALKTYGMYLADGGSDMYIQGDPSAAWDDAIFAEVQDVPASEFEAVDLSPITSRAGWSADSGRVP